MLGLDTAWWGWEKHAVGGGEGGLPGRARSQNEGSDKQNEKRAHTLAEKACAKATTPGKAWLCHQRDRKKLRVLRWEEREDRPVEALGGSQMRSTIISSTFLKIILATTEKIMERGPRECGSEATVKPRLLLSNSVATSHVRVCQSELK